jgi:hypothetical protein
MCEHEARTVGFRVGVMVSRDLVNHRYYKHTALW